MMKIRSKAKDISCSIAFHVIYEIFKINLILLGKRFTFDGYFTFEVLIFVLLHENRFNDNQYWSLSCSENVFFALCENLIRINFNDSEVIIN